jgi:hypothetical protein
MKLLLQCMSPQLAETASSRRRSDASGLRGEADSFCSL